MRISVMELGRFTAAQQFRSDRSTGDKLIMLHGARERNRSSEPVGHNCLAMRCTCGDSRLGCPGVGEAQPGF